MAVEQSQLQLPISIVGYGDVGHLLREAEDVDNFLRQAAIREPGTPMQLPKTSKLFEELVDTNKLNLLEENDRVMLLNLLKAVRAKAPVLHISFNNDPSPIFLQRLITWMRQQLHPFVLLQVGLNPTIGAGCVVRTTNKFFDFSLRHRFTEQRDLLINKLKEGAAQMATETAVLVEAPVSGEALVSVESSASVDATEPLQETTAPAVAVPVEVTTPTQDGAVTQEATPMQEAAEQEVTTPEATTSVPISIPDKARDVAAHAKEMHS